VDGKIAVISARSLGISFSPCPHSPSSLDVDQSLALSGKLRLTTDKLELGFVSGLEGEVLFEHGGSSRR
jgi:hypothetical protein